MFNTSSIATDDENGNMLTGYQTAENALAEMLLHAPSPLTGQLFIERSV